MDSRSRPRIAIVADSLNQRGGAEWVVAVLHQMFPRAPIFTPIVDTGNLWPELRGADIRVSWMQRLPGLSRHFRKYFLLYPLAIEGFDLSGYDLVLSSSWAFAKGARAPGGAAHVCYCHVPARFVWDYDDYVRRETFGRVTRAILPIFIRLLRRWDVAAARRPDVYVANSRAVAGQIRTHYGRPAAVIPPPVNVDRFTPRPTVAPYYLVLARLVAYRRIDLAVDAFTRLGLPLRVVGDGPARAALEARAGSTVRFLGHLPDQEVARMLGECQALVVPGAEDFGIAVLEANASGRPAIAYRAGGAEETVVDGETGVLFTEQTVDGVVDAVRRHREAGWEADLLRAHAMQYDVASFRARMTQLLSLVDRRIPIGAVEGDAGARRRAAVRDNVSAVHLGRGGGRRRRR